MDASDTRFAARVELAEDVDSARLLKRLAKAPAVVVGIAVYNAADAVRECLDSVIRHTPGDVELLVIDDASPDPETVAMLDEVAARGRITLVRHDENRGYTRTANHAMELAGGRDIVLLNSDTVVGPMWLQRLRWTAYSSDRVGTVSAVSNDASHVSIPVTRESNEWLGDWDDVARRVARGMYVWSIEAPFAGGFCFYLRAQALAEVGPFDAEAFPRGYGEEADLSLRAAAAGYTNLIAPHVMVRHARSQSFGSEARKALTQASRVVLHERYPHREDHIVDWRTSRGWALVEGVAERLRTSTTPRAPRAQEYPNAAAVVKAAIAGSVESLAAAGVAAEAATVLGLASRKS